jgi:hypothetical protein
MLSLVCTMLTSLRQLSHCNVTAINLAASHNINCSYGEDSASGLCRPMAPVVLLESYASAEDVGMLLLHVHPVIDEYTNQ